MVKTLYIQPSKAYNGILYSPYIIPSKGVLTMAHRILIQSSCRQEPWLILCGICERGQGPPTSGGRRRRHGGGFLQLQGVLYPIPQKRLGTGVGSQ